MKLKKIACIYIPHIFVDIETNRKIHRHPIIVTSGSSERSIIIDIDPSLTRYGISKGSYLKTLGTLVDSVDLCPINDDYYDYIDKIKRKIILFLKTFSPRVEEENYSRYFIDLTGTSKLFGRAIDTATKIIGELKEKFALTSKVGIGNNILTASTASMIAEENAVYEIAPLSERLFIQQLPLSIIPLFPNSIKRQLSADYNIITVSDIFRLSKNDLTPIAGEFETNLYNISRGISRDWLIAKPLEKGAKIDIIPEPGSSDYNIRKKVSDTLFEASLKFYNMGLYPGNLELTIIYQDGYQFKDFVKRGISPTLFCTGLYRLLLPHLNKALKRRTGIKRIIIKLSEFKSMARQLWLFSEFSEKNNLVKALTFIKKKYGKRYIKYGV